MPKAPCGAFLELERVMGIEPTLFAWEARVLPLNDTRDGGDCTLNPAAYSDHVGSLTGDDWGPLFWLTRWTFQQASLNLRF
jgi:hypothetical protein